MIGPALPSDDLGELQAWHAACRDAPLAVDMTRGLPSAEQIALSHAMLSLPGPTPFDSGTARIGSITAANREFPSYGPCSHRCCSACRPLRPQWAATAALH